MYIYLKFHSQVYNMPMPSYTVVYYVTYSLKWIDSLRLSSKLYALPTPTLSGSASISGVRNTLWQKWGGHVHSTPVHPVATPLRSNLD